MPIIEDDVKNAMARWLEVRGYAHIQFRLGTRQGYDVEGIEPKTNVRLVMECKGEAQTGSQHSRSWPNVASALLTSLNEQEDKENNHKVGMAFPNTPEYRGRMSLLKNFCINRELLVFWVSSDGSVEQWS